MENEHRPCALTNDEVTLPMAALGSAVDSFGPFVDGDAILDGIFAKVSIGVAGGVCDDA